MIHFSFEAQTSVITNFMIRGLKEKYKYNIYKKNSAYLVWYKV